MRLDRTDRGWMDGWLDANSASFFQASLSDICLSVCLPAELTDDSCLSHSFGFRLSFSEHRISLISKSAQKHSLPNSRAWRIRIFQRLAKAIGSLIRMRRAALKKVSQITRCSLRCEKTYHRSNNRMFLHGSQFQGKWCKLWMKSISDTVSDGVRTEWEIDANEGVICPLKRHLKMTTAHPEDISVTLSNTTTTRENQSQPKRNSQEER